MYKMIITSRSVLEESAITIVFRLDDWHTKAMKFAMGHLIHLLIQPLTFGRASDTGGRAAPDPSDSSDWQKERDAMIALLRERYRIESPAILQAMSKVERHLYIPNPRDPGVDPYGDHPCPIGHRQTISQPFIVAYMTEALDIEAGDKVLEIGTGSGYQASVLAELGAEVYSIEIIPQLNRRARKVIDAKGYKNIHILGGDGFAGWPEEISFDAIIVTCAPESVPSALTKQLAEGGKMIIPVGSGIQKLTRIRKLKGRIHHQGDISVRFVPMIHKTRA